MIIDRLNAVLSSKGLAQQLAQSQELLGSLRVVFEAHERAETAYSKSLEGLFQQLGKQIERFQFARQPLEYLKDLLTINYEHRKNLIRSLKQDLLASLGKQEVRRDSQAIAQSKQLREGCLKQLADIKALGERRRRAREELSRLKTDLNVKMSVRPYEDKERKEANSQYISQRTELKLIEQEFSEKVQSFRRAAQLFDARQEVEAGRRCASEFVSFLYGLVVKFLVLWAQVIKNSEYDFGKMLERLEAGKEREAEQAERALVGREGSLGELVGRLEEQG